MKIEKIKYGDEYIYINNEKIDEKQTGIIIKDDNKESFENTMTFEPISDDFLEDTMTIDIEGINHE